MDKYFKATAAVSGDDAHMDNKSGQADQNAQIVLEFCAQLLSQFDGAMDISWFSSTQDSARLRNGHDSLTQQDGDRRGSTPLDSHQVPTVPTADQEEDEDQTRLSSHLQTLSDKEAFQQTLCNYLNNK